MSTNKSGGVHWCATHKVGRIFVYIREDKKKWAIGYMDGVGFISDHWRSEKSAIQAAKNMTPIMVMEGSEICGWNSFKRD